MTDLVKCKYCGVKICFRHVKHRGHALPFDANEYEEPVDIHKCGRLLAEKKLLSSGYEDDGFVIEESSDGEDCDMDETYAPEEDDESSNDEKYISEDDECLNDQTRYEVEAIENYDKASNTFLVRWKGYSERTWENAKRIRVEAPYMVGEFHQKELDKMLEQSSKPKNSIQKKKKTSEQKWWDDAQLECICSSVLDSSDLGHMRARFQIFYPRSDEYFLKSIQGNRIDASQKILSGDVKVKVNDMVTFCFCNQDGSHWRLIILDGINRIITLFDPLGRLFEKQLKNDLKFFYGYEINDLGTCVQTDSYSCGPWGVYICKLYAMWIAGKIRGNTFLKVLSSQQDFILLSTPCSQVNREYNQMFADDIRREFLRLLQDIEHENTYMPPTLYQEPVRVFANTHWCNDQSHFFLKKQADKRESWNLWKYMTGRS